MLNTRSRDNLLEQQSTLFKDTLARNAELEIRNEEIERELGVWKTALKVSEDKEKALEKTVAVHERIIVRRPTYDTFSPL